MLSQLPTVTQQGGGRAGSRAGAVGWGSSGQTAGIQDGRIHMERVSRPCSICQQRKCGDHYTGMPKEVRLLEPKLSQQVTAGEQGTSPSPCSPLRPWLVPGGLLRGCRGAVDPDLHKAPSGLLSILALLCVDREALEDKSLLLQVDGRARGCSAHRSVWPGTQ